MPAIPLPRLGGSPLGGPSLRLLAAPPPVPTSGPTGEEIPVIHPVRTTVASLDDAGTPEARAALGLGSAATHDTADYLAPAGDGSGLTSLDASALATGTVSTARLGTGAASSGTFLRGDGTWAAPAGGGAPGGTSGQVQYNDAGALGGFGAWDGTTFAVGGALTAGGGSLTRVDGTTVAGFSAIYFGAGAAAPTGSNWSFLGNGSTTALNATSGGDLELRCGGATAIVVSDISHPTVSRVICGYNPSGTDGDPDATVTVIPLNGTFRGLAIQGAASQTAPLLPLRQLSSTATPRDAGIVDAVFATDVDASWKGRLVLYAGDFTSTNAGRREGVRVESDGTQALVSVYGVAAVARAAAIATPTDLASCITAITAIRDAIKNFGITS